MRKQAGGIIQNVSYAILSNGVVLASSMLISLLIPAFCSVDFYGYLQLYLFYSSYLGLFNIGWLEGIYLRIGGIAYKDIDFPLYRAQYRIFRRYIISASLLGCIFSIFFVSDEIRRMIFTGVFICGIPYALTNYWNNILLLTGRMKEYARSCFCDKGTFLLIVAGMIIFKCQDLRVIILADITGKAMAFVSGKIACKELYAKLPMVGSRILFKEIVTNISCGIKLLIANLSSMFILGSIRMGIEQAWNIETYSQMSLTLSVSNLLLGFISAVSQVMYTTARKMAGDKLTDIYQKLRKLMVLLLLAFMIAYYPIQLMLVSILPKYEYGLRYMAILLPMCVIECKWSFLTLTYLKVIREEKSILKVNVFSVMLSIILTCITVFALKNLMLTVCLVIFILFIRGTLGEKILADRMQCNINRDIVKEAAVILCFVIISWNINSWLCMMLYMGVYMLYLLSEWKNVRELYFSLRKLLVYR